MEAAIPLMRPQSYDKLYFKPKMTVLQGVDFPLTEGAYKRKNGINAPKPWKDVLSAYGLDSRNLSYPLE